MTSEICKAVACLFFLQIQRKSGVLHGAPEKVCKTFAAMPCNVKKIKIILIMDTKKILNAFTEKRGEPKKGEMYICYPCDIHDANAYCVLVEKDTRPHTIYERYITEDLGSSVVFEQMNTKIHSRKI